MIDGNALAERSTRPGAGATMLAALLVSLLAPGIMIAGLMMLDAVWRFDPASFSWNDFVDLLIAIPGVFLFGLLMIAALPIAFLLSFGLTMLAAGAIIRYDLGGGLGRRLPWLLAGAGIGAIVGVAIPIQRFEVAWPAALPGAVTGMIAMLICRRVLRYAERVNGAAARGLS